LHPAWVHDAEKGGQMTIETHSGEQRILVVDDHSISSRYTMAALRQRSGVVKRVQTARDALEMALTWRPDLICMDIHLPDSNGLEVIRRIRQAWPTDRPQPRIIVLTGSESALKQNDLAVLDIACLLVKPVSAKDLRDAAWLDSNNRVNEESPAGQGRELQALFREELERRLPELDQSISNLDRNQAVGILHQLIASSAMCHENKLESGLRALDASCRRDDSTAELARVYYAVLELAQEFLSRPVSRTRHSQSL